MHYTIPLEQQKYHLYNNHLKDWEGYFEDYQHVLYHFQWTDLTDLAHNENDKAGRFIYPYAQAKYTLTPKPYILYDSLMRVVSGDQIAKDIQSYQKPKRNPYKAIKRGTNKHRAHGGYRRSHSYKNVLATLLGDKDIMPLNKRDVQMRARVLDWDAGQLSNKGDSWKLQKKKHQWEDKC